MRTSPARVVILIVTLMSGAAFSQSAVISELAPLGKLRVGLLGYNPVLVTRRTDASIDGVSPRVGKFIADKLGVAFEPVIYGTPQSGVDSYGTDQWDILIGPRSPAVEQKVDFSPDVMLVDNLYVARPGRDFADADEVDRPGVRIGVALNGVPDQFLSRSLKLAELVRVAAPVPVAIDTLRSAKADVFASNGQIVYAVAAGVPGAKLVPGAFLSVHMAIALPKGRSVAAQNELAKIVEEAKRGGLVGRAIEEAGLKAVRIAPN
jgi:polar amino acid transport system substrate-binding protein